MVLMKFLMTGVFCFAPLAWAQVSNIPLGSSEGLMANTGTGYVHANFPSYYNPASLSWVKQEHFSFSGVAFNSINSKSTESSGAAGSSSLELQSQKLTTSNLFTVLTPAMGNVALYLYLPTDIESRSTYHSPSTLLANSTEQNRIDLRSQTSIVGFSFAPRNDEKDWWSFGFNAQIEYQEQKIETNLFRVNDANNGGQFVASSLRKNHLGITTSFGNIYQISERVSMGYTFTLPAFTLSKKSVSDSQSLSYNYEVPNSFTSSSQSITSDSLAPLPFRSRVGIYYHGRRIDWGIDVAHSERQYDSDQQIKVSSGMNIRWSDSTGILFGLSRSIMQNFGLTEDFKTTLLTGGLELKAKIYTTSVGLYSLALDSSAANSKISIYGVIFNTLYRF